MEINRSWSKHRHPPGKARKFLSKSLVALFDRLRVCFDLANYALRYFPLRTKLRRDFPHVRFASHWESYFWGEFQILAVTGRFQIPVSMFPEIVQGWQYREIKAFTAGEPYISRFFDYDATHVDNSVRRKATPILLQADPKDFTILLTVTPRGIEVIDGAHRLSIAVIKGHDSVGAKVVYPVRVKSDLPISSYLLQPFTLQFWRNIADMG